MAYVKTPGIKYDLFISYARVDNLCTSAEETGWVEQFIRDLNICLSKRIGRMNVLTCFWDNSDLAGNQPVNASIEQAMGSSAVILCLVSEGFLHPDCYCSKELAWFEQKAAASPAGIAPGNNSRFFPILLKDISYQQWPEQLRGKVGFPMHTEPVKGKVCQPLDNTSEEYRDRQLVLADKIFETLNSINHAGSTSGAATGTQRTGVFLAHVADSQDLAYVRDTLKQGLQTGGYNAVTPGPLTGPFYAQIYAGQVKKQLAQTVLSIHLFDKRPGDLVDEDTGITLPRQQFETAKKMQQPAYIWVPGELDISRVRDPEQREFLEQIEKGQFKEWDYDFSRCFEDEVTAEVLKKLEKYQQQSAAAAEDTRQKPSIFLNYHFKDTRPASKLIDILGEKQCELLMFQEIDNPALDDEGFKQRLGMSDVLLLYYRNVVRDWVIRRVEMAVKFIASGVNPALVQRFKAIGIYPVPPADTRGMAFPPFYRIRWLNKGGSKQVKPGELSDFFRDIGLEGDI